MAKKCPTMRAISRSWKKLPAKQKNKWKEKATGNKTGWNVYVADKRKGCTK